MLSVSFPQLSSVRVKELCELLSYWNGASFICKSQVRFVSNLLFSLLHGDCNHKYCLCFCFVFQIERFIRMGIPPSLRGRVWKCLLAIDSLRENSDFNYQVKYNETYSQEKGLCHPVSDEMHCITDTMSVQPRRRN